MVAGDKPEGGRRHVNEPTVVGYLAADLTPPGATMGERARYLRGLLDDGWRCEWLSVFIPPGNGNGAGKAAWQTGRKWTADEDAALRRYRRRGLNAQQCAALLGRTPGGVWNRMAKLAAEQR